MFKDLFIRVSAERLALEAPLLIKMKASPEIYIKAEKIKEFTTKKVSETAEILSSFSSHTIHAPFMDVWPGAADEDIRRLGLEQMQKIMEIAAAWKSLLVVMHFNYDPIYYRQQFGQSFIRYCCGSATVLFSPWKISPNPLHLLPCN
jgi:hypothetical protein